MTLIVNSIWPTIQGEGPHAGQPAIFIRLTGCNLRCHFCDTEFEKGEEMHISTIVKKVKALMEHCSTDLIVMTGGEPLRQQIIPTLWAFAHEGWFTQIETAGTVWPPTAWVSKPDDGPRRDEVQVCNFDELAGKAPATFGPSAPDNEGMPPGRFISLDELIMGTDVELVCSPKTPKVHAKIEEHCEHFKYIIRKGDTCEDTGLPIANTQTGEHSPKRLWVPDMNDAFPTIWLQPMQEYERIMDQGITIGEDSNRTEENVQEVVRLAMRHGYRISLQTHRILHVD